jgi:hypothetical protein
LSWFLTSCPFVDSLLKYLNHPVLRAPCISLASTCMYSTFLSLKLGTRPRSFIGIVATIYYIGLLRMGWVS